MGHIDDFCSYIIEILHICYFFVRYTNTGIEDDGERGGRNLCGPMMFE